MKKTAIIITLVLSCIYILAQQSTQMQASKARGEKIYNQYCLSCHQKDGNGVPKLNPPLIKTSYVTGDKKKLITWVLRGSAEKVPIDGKYYSNNMAPQDYLKDNEIADVLTFIRNSFGNRATAVTPADVKAVRAGIK